MFKDYIAQLFARWKKKTGLVVSPHFGNEAGKFSSDLKAAFLNSYQERWQCSALAMLCRDLLLLGLWFSAFAKV